MKTKRETEVHFKRPCLLVADFERSFSIYRDLLGFEVDYISEEAKPESYLYNVFKIPKIAKLRFATLTTKYEDRALALTEVKGIELPKPSLPHSVGLVIRTPDLEGAIAKIVRLGLETVKANSFSPSEVSIVTEQAFCDYDGHLIVLYEAKDTNSEK